MVGWKGFLFFALHCFVGCLAAVPHFSTGLKRVRPSSAELNAARLHSTQAQPISALLTSVLLFVNRAQPVLPRLTAARFFCQQSTTHFSVHRSRLKGTIKLSGRKTVNSSEHRYLNKTQSSDLQAMIEPVTA